METCVNDSAAESTTGPVPASSWVQNVISLLDAALRQLHQPEHIAQNTIVKARVLLRKQLGLQVAQAAPEGSGRLLGWQARKVRDYIESHITDPLPVSDLCALVQRSQAHFSRSFKRTFGESPHAFVIRRRLELATLYMLQTEASLSEIALRCGFVDQAHFSRHFRQSTGQTPAAWRRTCMSHDYEPAAMPTFGFAQSGYAGTLRP